MNLVTTAIAAATRLQKHEGAPPRHGDRRAPPTSTPPPCCVTHTGDLSGAAGPARAPDWVTAPDLSAALTALDIAHHTHRER
jgi:hypothetical protein